VHEREIPASPIPNESPSPNGNDACNEGAHQFRRQLLLENLDDARWLGTQRNSESVTRAVAFEWLSSNHIKVRYVPQIDNL